MQAMITKMRERRLILENMRPSSAFQYRPASKKNAAAKTQGAAAEVQRSQRLR
jgi:hypothetical protein